MSREEALTAVLNAARSLRQAFPSGGSLPVPRTALVQLYAAVDAVDAVGEPAPVVDDYASVPGRLVGHIRGTYVPIDRPGLCSTAECWRTADLPTGTCHHHSEHAAKLHPWQTAQLRAGVFATPEEA